MEVSAETGPHCVCRVGEECSLFFKYIVSYVRIMVLQRSANAFLTAGGSWNGVGCVGSSALRVMMMSCSYVFQVLVVIRIVKNAGFL